MAASVTPVVVGKRDAIKDVVVTSLSTTIGSPLDATIICPLWSSLRNDVPVPVIVVEAAEKDIVPVMATPVNVSLMFLLPA